MKRPMRYALLHYTLNEPSKYFPPADRLRRRILGWLHTRDLA